jgi:large subunit ribosomal protein L18
MSIASKRYTDRKRRQARVRRKIRGTAERPRLCVYRSLRYTYVQLISDETGSVLGTVSSKSLDTAGASPSSRDSAKLVGAKIAELAKEKSIESVVFDRNGYVYHGRVAAVAEGAREAGLDF